MCTTNNFIERQAYEMSQQIRKESLYKIVRVDYFEDYSQNAKKRNLDTQDFDIASSSALITKVILEDKDRAIYSVEPNLNGLRFAKGEIDYKKYNKLQQRETFNGIATFSAIVVFFSGVMFIFINFLT